MPSPTPLSEQESVLLKALAGMALQYLTVTSDDGEYLDTLNMSAGEHALQVLHEYGLVEAVSHFRSAVWTELGEDFLRDRA